MSKEKKINIQNIWENIRTAIVTHDILKYKKVRKKKIGIRGISKSEHVIFGIINIASSIMKDVWKEILNYYIRAEKYICTNFVKCNVKLDVIKDILYTRCSKRRLITSMLIKEGDWEVSNMKKYGVLNDIIRSNAPHDNYYYCKIIYNKSLRGDYSTRIVDTNNHNFVAY